VASPGSDAIAVAAITSITMTSMEALSKLESCLTISIHNNILVIFSYFDVFRRRAVSYKVLVLLGILGIA
jgi:hypothetical protein